MLTHDEKLFLTTWLMEIGSSPLYIGLGMVDALDKYPATQAVYWGDGNDATVTVLQHKGYVLQDRSGMARLTQKALDAIGQVSESGD